MGGFFFDCGAQKECELNWKKLAFFRASETKICPRKVKVVFSKMFVGILHVVDVTELCKSVRLVNFLLG